MKLPSSKFKLTLLATGAILAAALGISYVCQSLGLPEQDQILMVKAFRAQMGWNAKFVMLLAQILVFAPLLEEPLFRFLLFRLPARFVSREESTNLFTAPWALVVAIVSSVLFTLAHNIDFASIGNGHGFALKPISSAFVSLFVVGLGWCWLYRHTRSLWCSMLSHFIFNLTNLVLLLLFGM